MLWKITYKQEEAMRTFLTEHGFENVIFEWRNDNMQPFAPLAGFYITASKAKVSTD